MRLNDYSMRGKKAYHSIILIWSEEKDEDDAKKSLPSGADAVPPFVGALNLHFPLALFEISCKIYT
jgi:hypothetical protein